VVLAPLEDNFYTRSRFPDAMILSLFQTEEICKRSGRRAEEYIVISLLMHLLWLQFKFRNSEAHYDNLFHREVRGCLFDWTMHKPDKVHKLKTGCIELKCKSRLIEANVPESVILSAEKILNRVKKTSFRDSFIEGLRNPFFSFLFGGVVIGLFINFFTAIAGEQLGSSSKYYVLAGLFLLIIVLALGNHVWVLLKNRAR
jgi:hypothetical protein